MIPTAEFVLALFLAAAAGLALGRWIERLTKRRPTVTEAQMAAALELPSNVRLLDAGPNRKRGGAA